MKSVDVVFTEVMMGLSDVNENGEVVAIDIDGMTELVKMIQAKKKELKDLVAEQEKETKKAKNAELAAAGKAYYDSLAIGDTFQYRDAKGKIWEVTKIETKSNSGLSAACKVSDEIRIANNWKKAEKYPKFYQVVIPTDAE